MEFHGFFNTLYISIITMLFLFGCAGSNQVQEVDPSLQEDIRLRGEQLEEVRSLLTLGTPRFLDMALNMLERSDLNTTEQGSEYRYLIGRIYHTVYPYLEYAGFEVQPPAGSVYVTIFNQIEQGKVPEINQENTTFLSSLAVATSILKVGEDVQREKAGSTITYLVKINPNSTLTLFLYGYYLETQNDLESAEFYYRQALERDDSCYPARLGLVRIYSVQGKPRSALPDVETLLLEFPEESEVLKWAVSIFLQDGQLQKADSLLSRAIILYPDQIVFLRKRVELLEKQQKHDQAARIARVIQKSVGETPETLYVDIQTLIRQGRLTVALTRVREAMDRFPDYREFSSLYGGLLLQLDRQEDAYRFFREELDKNSANLSVVSSLLDTAVALEKWEEAALYVEMLLPQRESVQVYSQAVNVYRQLGEIDMALETALNLAQKFPDNPDAVEPYLSLLLQLDRRQEAENFIIRFRQEQRSPEVKSLLYYFQAQLAAAAETKLQNLQLALLENIQNFDALREIALLYESIGEYDKAARYLRQAIALQPQNEQLRLKLREIEGLR